MSGSWVNPIESKSLHICTSHQIIDDIMRLNMMKLRAYIDFSHGQNRRNWMNFMFEFCLEQFYYYNTGNENARIANFYTETTRKFSNKYSM